MVKQLEVSPVRSQVVTVRLDPKLKYLAELGARKQRRALSSFIEWAVEQALDQVILREAEDFEGTKVSVNNAEKALALYDVDEADRLARLAVNFPELLTHDEQVVWKLIRECGALWLGSYSGTDGKWTWRCEAKTLQWDLLRKHWATFLAVARGEMKDDALPTWRKYRTTISEDGGNLKIGKKAEPKSELDDDIPF